MTDPIHSSSIDSSSLPAKRGMFWWLHGRAGRSEYWVYVGLIFGLGIVLGYVPGLESAGMGLTVALAFAQARRLHDVDRSGWWAVAATLAPLVVMLPVLAVSMTAGLAVGVLAEIAIVIWIGALRGDPAENRFGPQPPFTWRRVLTGR